MQIQTLYYLEITQEDIRAAEIDRQEGKSRSETCPISQAMARVFPSILIRTAGNWTSPDFFNIEFAGYERSIEKYIHLADNDMAEPTILLLEYIP